MLTLTRSVGERIYIGDDIVVEVRAILDGRQVRIAIDAPRQVPIHRAEILEAVSRQNRAASEVDPAALARLVRSPEQAPPATPPPPAGSEHGVDPPPLLPGAQA